MAGFTATTWIDAMPAQIFTLISDVRYFPAILPSVQHAEKLTDGPVALGTRFSETRLINGRDATSEIEVTLYEPPQRYAATTVQQGVTATYTYTFISEKRGTRVDLQANVSADGLRKLILPIVVGIIKKEDADHLANLKRVVEGQQRDG